VEAGMGALTMEGYYTGFKPNANVEKDLASKFEDLQEIETILSKTSSC
jgi:hypothetical protein